MTQKVYQKNLDENNAKNTEFKNYYAEGKAAEKIINEVLKSFEKTDPVNYKFFINNRKYYHKLSNKQEEDEAEKFKRGFEKYLQDIYIDKARKNDKLTKDFVKKYGICIADNNIETLKNMFNNEQQVQKVYSELSKIKEGIEQLEKKKKDLESELGKPKVNPVDFRDELKYEDPKESKEDTNNFDIKSNYEDPDDPDNLDVES